MAARRYGRKILDVHPATVIFTFSLRRGVAIAMAAGVMLGQAGVMRAHHSMAMYDTQKNIIVTGVLRRIELKNPHSMFYLTVTDAQGREVEWTLESQPLATLTLNGWSASTLKAGDTVTAVGSPARNGTNAMLVRAIQLPDGRSLKT